jgi:predicted Rossmann fold flavoprotein
MEFDTLILGAGAAGMFCAMHAGPGVLVVDHAAAPGEKIRISGGGRCNFTNLHTSPANFLSQNRHFAKSALSRYTPQAFIALVDSYGINWHEKTLGQLFCDRSAKDIVAMLRAEMDKAGAQLWLQTTVDAVSHDGTNFQAQLTRDGRAVTVTAHNLVIATGGKSIPKMGATGLAYQIAAQFGHKLVETRPALVPLTFDADRFAPLAGVALPVRASAGAASFDEALLFTHRGLSGPAILQISSYWTEGLAISINLLPQPDLVGRLKAMRQTLGKKQVSTVLAQLMPARLAESLSPGLPARGLMADQSDAQLSALCAALQDWTLRPTGSEGYRTAEVTLGGVDTAGLSSQSMMSKTLPGLYFIGECVDVTGWLGGYNFQWAWASGFVAAQAIAAQRRA